MFTKKNLLIIIGQNILISFLAITIALVGIIFLSKKISKISDSVVLNHKFEAELQKRTEFLKILEQDIQTIGKNNVLIENSFVPADNILSFINSLDNLATKNSIKQAYRFETPIVSSISSEFPISTVSYSNSFLANFQTFSNYLKEFEKLPYFTKIEGLTISSQDKELGWLGQSTISYRAILYAKNTQ